MFTSQSLRAVVPPGALTVREQRLDDVVHQLDVRGTLDATTLGELARPIDAALAGGVRWLIVDLSGTVTVADQALARARDGGARAALAQGRADRRGRERRRRRSGSSLFDVAHRPAQAATVDQAIMILKMLRPKTGVTHPTQPRAKQRITSMTLPRIEPTT